MNYSHPKSPYILCVGNGWFPTMPGGLNRYVCELIRHLAADGDRIELCGVGLPKTAPASTVKLTNLAEPDRALWQRLRSSRTQFLRRNTEKPRAINLHFALYSLPLLSSLPAGVPVTFTFHGPWALESEREGGHPLSVALKHWMEQRVYRRCDRFIVLSKAFGEILHQHYQIPWSQIRVIPGGVDTQQFQPNLSRQQAREQLRWPGDRPILFSPRRLVRRMGIDTLLHALARVRVKVPEVWLAIAGKGPLRDTLEQQATELGLEDRVKFLGFLPDEQLPIAYQAADLTVIPSQSLEGFGLVVLESLACGTPVLCTPVGGMPEILEPFSPELIARATDVARSRERSGVPRALSEGTDADAIALRLQAILTGDIPLPSREACRNYTEQNFAWTKIAPEVRRAILDF